MYYNLPQAQIKKLQKIQNFLARAVTRTPKSSHITTVLKSLHWLKINERIKYKLFSLTYKVLTTNQPQYLHDLISVQPCHNTRSLSVVTLACPLTRFSLKITNRSFRYAAPCLWNELPTDLREPRQIQSPSLSPITHGSHHLHYLHHLHYHRLHLLLLVQYFILNSSANPFLHRPFPFLPD